MKLNISRALLFATLGILGSVAPVAKAQNSAIVGFVRSYDRAWNTKDITFVERALANSYVYFSSKGEVSSRRQTLDLLRSPSYILTSADRTEIEVYRTGSTAIVSGRWRGHGSYNGEEFRDDQRCSLVLTRAGRKWQIVAEHCTQIVARLGSRFVSHDTSVRERI